LNPILNPIWRSLDEDNTSNRRIHFSNPSSVSIAAVIDRGAAFAKPQRQSFTDLYDAAQRSCLYDHESVCGSSNGDVRSSLATALPVTEPACGGVRSVMAISRIAVPDVRMYASAIFATSSRPRGAAGGVRP
jgi:hypothetical protein